MNHYCKAGGLKFVSDSMNERKQLKESLLRLESQTIANLTHLTIEESKIVSTVTTLLLRYLFLMSPLGE